MTSPDRPGAIRVVPPDITVHLVPVAGPPGLPGPAGDAATALGHVHTQIAPSALIQVNHGLVFRPAAAVCVDNSGRIIEFDTLTWPSVGVMQIDFGGVPFSGTIYLS